jgi:hypothetical protein
MKNATIIFIIFLLACKQNASLESKKGNETTTYVTNDTIPEIRKEVSKKPVASYWVQINPVLEQKFGVDIFETRKTFQYLLKMRYENMIVKDTLQVPNFGVWPKIEGRKGKEKLSCIIGFLDKKKQFKEHKLLIVKNDQLQLKVLKRYYVGVYRDQQ